MGSVITIPARRDTFMWRASVLSESIPGRIGEQSEYGTFSMELQ